MTRALSEGEIDVALVQYEGWNKRDHGSVSKRFTFSDFDAAMEFVNACADIARKQDHHPALLIEYNVVSVTTWTHDIGGVSEKDVKLIEEIERLVRVH